MSCLFGFLVLVQIALPATPVQSAGIQSYGTVLVTNSAGVIRPPDASFPKDARAVSIDGRGGLLWTTAAGVSARLESRGYHGAMLGIESEGEWVLREGSLDVSSKSALTVRIAESIVRLKGRAVMTHIPEIESVVRILDGSADVRVRDRTLNLKSLDAIRLSESAEPQSERLLPPPIVADLKPVSVLPILLAASVTDEHILAGAILVECSTREHFWKEAKRFLFHPAEPLILPDLPEGPVYVRVRSVSRSGLEGPPTPTAQTTVLRSPVRLAARQAIQTRIIRGQLVPPLENLPVRWDNLRAVTDSQGRFELHPDDPFGLTAAPLEVELNGGRQIIADPVVFLSDPDHLSYILPSAGENGAPQLFIRVSDLRVRSASDRIRIFLDGTQLASEETRVMAPPAISRDIQFKYPDTSVHVTLIHDAEGPRILNVSLEIRGAAEKLYVLADVLDLGIGLRLPAHATFENDAGEQIHIPLQKVSPIRLEGSARTDVPLRRRSQIWWVRVQASDLLGNTSLFENSVYHKRQKKFLSVGLKDLVKIWKNKL